MKVSAPAKSLRQRLHKHIHRSEDDRPPWKLHASDITKEDPEFCPRYAVLMRKLKIPLTTRTVNTHDAVTWEWGRMCENRVREWFAEMGLLVGDWQCQGGGCGRVLEWQKRPSKCFKCGSSRFRYVEKRAVSETCGASCGIDMLLNLGGPLLRLVEVKSLDKDKFKELAAPYAEHRVRTAFYQRIIAECAEPWAKKIDVKSADVLYVSKGGYGRQEKSMYEWDFSDGQFTPFAEYAVHRDDATTEPYAEKSRAAFLALKGEGPIPDRICPAEGCKRAQICPARAACFSSKGW